MKARIWLPLLVLLPACTPRTSVPTPTPTPTPVPTTAAAVTPMATETVAATRTPVVQATATPVQTPAGSYTDAQILEWKLQTVCISIRRDEFPKVLRRLSDGTLLYERRNGTLFRGTPNTCKCLPPDTMIATPNGDTRIDELNRGDLVWTEDENGKRVADQIVAIQISDVGNQHEVVQLILDDGRAVSASPLHPLPDGRTFGGLAGGDAVDSAQVVGVGRAPFLGAQTRDIRPAGPTGVYWANGVRVGTTIPAGEQPLVVRTATPAPTPPAAAAAERLERAEAIFAEYTAAPIEGQDSKKLVRLLKLKLKKYQDVTRAYDRVIALNDLDTQITARTRQGQASEHLADSLERFPAPDHLTEDQREIFRTSLAEKARPVREQAASYYELAIGLAEKNGVESGEANRARWRLRELKRRAESP